MKIGIITHYLHYGYGGVLQNFALQTVLKRLGHDPITLRSAVVPKVAILRRVRNFLSKYVHLLLGKDIKSITAKQDEFISTNTERFVKKYINYTEPCGNQSEFRERAVEEKCDVLLVGSDQIWRAHFAYCEECFLNFAYEMDVKRIAYAASFAVSNWEFSPKQTSRIVPLAKKFNAVSVRESSAVNLCREYLGVESQLVLDPTLLLKREDYMDLIKAENEEKSEGTLFTYILDKSQEKERIISSLAKDFNMTRYECMPKYETSYLSIKRHPEESVYPSVTRWLRSIYEAELVVTDSFHGTAFSIIFNKPFYVILNINRGADRFISLLNLFGLDDRIISGTSEISNNPIDWSRVNKIREEWGNKSLKFLVDALK